MNSRERVLCSISHGRPDRTPKGDLAIEAKLECELAKTGGYDGDNPNELRLAALRFLGADIVHVHDYPVQPIGNDSQGRPLYHGAFGEEFALGEYGHALVKPALSDASEAFTYRMPSTELFPSEKINFFRREQDLFISAQVGGPISNMTWALGMENTMVWCLTEPEAMLAFANQMAEFEVLRAFYFLDHGADAILIADDIAHNTGPFMRPHTMQRFAWPFYKMMLGRIKAHRNVPVFLHTDGDIRTLLQQISDCGFDGLQSLQPSANVDILAVKRQYGNRLCLWGNLDLDQLMTFGTPLEVVEKTRWLCRNIGYDGGFILSTCNILIDAVPIENAIAMYTAAE
jgi:uroporphyrinogen decarboxylase